MTMSHTSLDTWMQEAPSVPDPNPQQADPPRVHIVATGDDVDQIRQAIWHNRYESEELLRSFLLHIVMDPPSSFVKTSRVASELLMLLEIGAASFDEVGQQIKQAYDVFVATRLADSQFVTRVTQRWLRDRHLEWFKTILGAASDVLA